VHRTLVQLEESLYQQLRDLAHERGLSLSALVRELLNKALHGPAKKKKMKIDQFKFIGSGRSKEKNISERHDDYLAEDILT
jgi:predicted DNA-binding ribbon-helix-helix protein